MIRVYNRLDLDHFPYASPASRPQVVAAVGRLVEKLGFLDLLDAVALLVRQGRPVHLDLVGTGPLEDVVRSRVQDLGLAAVVHLRGALPQSQVRCIVQAAAVRRARSPKQRCPRRTSSCASMKEWPAGRDGSPALPSGCTWWPTGSTPFGSDRRTAP